MPERAVKKTASVSHPLFARVYARVGAAAEAKGGAEHRDEMLDGLSGRVIEVGAGTGLNFRHYPSTVTGVLAVEPEPFLRGIATDEAGRSSLPIEVVDGVADALSAEDASQDAGVASLVLCSVPDQERALAELFRVIRPGGELRFYEHIRGESAGFARFQRVVDVIHPLMGGGCHASRDTVRAIERAGFVIEAIRRFRFVVCFVDQAIAPHVIGKARRPA
jgi:ubiquinone/menaquinone biosynthesis C-methylase UbiE